MLKGTCVRLASSIAALAMSLTAGAAHAQTSGARDPVTAEALFVEGKRLLQGHDYANACPKLAESQRLDPSGGTIFALGLCYEGAGSTATAWATFSDALAEARRDRRADREAGAIEHIHALEQKLTRLRIDVPHPVPGIEVLRNGTPVGTILWGTAIPIDPGPQSFEARAPGKLSWTYTTRVDRPGEVVTIPVPELANAPIPVVPVAAPGSVVAAPSAPPVVSTPPHAKKSYLLPELGFGVTVVSAVVGASLGAAASSEWSKAQAATGTNRPTMASTAGTEADVATGAFVVCGVAGVASGVVVAVLLTSDGDAPRDGDRPKSTLHVAPTIGVGSFGLSFGGAL